MNQPTNPSPCVVGGTSTYSKRLLGDLLGGPVVGSSGCTVRTREKSFVDWTASLGALILGYRPPPIEAQRWLVPGLTTVEEKAAQLLVAHLGGRNQRVRWCKNGSDATEAGVRLARHYTQRSLIITNSYHGSHDALLPATTGKLGGVGPENSHNLCRVQNPEDLLQALKALPVAAVVMEPMTPHCLDWRLEEVREACTQRGTLLIFDEIITGWRTRLGSAALHIEPDLYTVGKAIGNGAPIAALVGKPALMGLLEEEVFFSGTYAGELLSLASTFDTVEKLEATPYTRFQDWGEQLRTALQGICVGYPQRLRLTLQGPQHLAFVRGLASRGVLVGWDFFQMADHTPEALNQTIQAIHATRKELSL